MWRESSERGDSSRRGVKRGRSRREPGDEPSGASPPTDAKEEIRPPKTGEDTHNCICCLLPASRSPAAVAGTPNCSSTNDFFSQVRLSVGFDFSAAIHLFSYVVWGLGGPGVV